MDIELNGVWCTSIVAVVVAGILSTGSYKWIETLMLPLVLLFTITTLMLYCMQFTEYQVSAGELLKGMTPDFSAFIALAALALSAYGYTGTTSGDRSAYTYWAIEKGYPSFLGSNRDHPDWEKHARGWMKVLHTDVLFGLIIVTCATVPFYVLGAGLKSNGTGTRRK